MYAADFRKIARDSLRGRWTTAVFATLVAGILGGTGSSGGSVNTNLNLDESTLKQWESALGSEVMMEYLIMSQTFDRAVCRFVVNAVCYSRHRSCIQLRHGAVHHA